MFVAGTFRRRHPMRPSTFGDSGPQREPTCIVTTFRPWRPTSLRARLIALSSRLSKNRLAEVKSHMSISACDDRKSVSMRFTGEVFVRNAGVLFQPLGGSPASERGPQRAVDFTECPAHFMAGIDLLNRPIWICQKHRVEFGIHFW